MNTLSLLLYLADVVYQLQMLMFGGIVCGWILYVIFVGWQRIWASETFPWDEPEIREKKKELRKKNILPNPKWVWVSVVLMVLLHLIPKQDTFYLIAASEVGEAIVTTPEAKEILQDVKEILDVQLEKLKQ